jgi:uncharacterized membrane protein YccC
LTEARVAAGEEPRAGWLVRHRPELKLALRMVAAGLITYVIAHLFALAQGYWAVLTAVIVMQASVGGSLKAIVDRLAGTIGGAAWGVAVAITLPHTEPVSTLIALAAALVPLSILVGFRPAYRVAPVTAIIVLLLGPGHGSEVVRSGLSRVGEIGLGAIIALAVALVSPSRAEGVLLEAARDALAAMAELVHLLFGGIAADLDEAAAQRLHDRIRAAIEAAQSAAGEAARERASHVSDALDPTPVPRTLRRLSNDLAMVGRALVGALPPPLAEELAASAAGTATSLAGIFREIGTALVAHIPPPSPDDLARRLADCETIVARLHVAGLKPGVAEADAGRIFGLAFALEQLRRNLDELCSRARERAPQSPATG